MPPSCVADARCSMNDDDPARHDELSQADGGEPALDPPARPDDASSMRREIDRLRAQLSTAEFRELALRRELQHRVRNVLAVVRSIYRRSRESGASHEEFAEHFEGRLTAVARYQAHVDETEPGGIEVEDMVRDELLETRCLDRPDCTIAGPPIRLWQKPAELMGLAIHELATNSIKFGALAQGAALNVGWSFDTDQRVLRFRWKESGVSVAGFAPRPSGFGRQLIEEALPYQLGATTSFDLRPGGLDCSIVLSLPGSQAGGSTGAGYGGGYATEASSLPPSTPV